MKGPVPGQRGSAPASARLGPDAVERYLEQAVSGDDRAGVRVALDLIDTGVPAGDVIAGLLGPAQREVGERWLANRWSVTEEHLVSGATQKALDVIAHAIGPPTVSGLIAVTCAEGDWHSLPAQMFAEMLRGRGFNIAFLGPSGPVDHVASFLTRRRPQALVVSCNLALFFGGVTRLADAAHRHAIPVLAGGQALGRSPKRAACLGADAWAAGVDDAVAVLRGWQREPPPVPAEPTPFEAAAVRLDFIAPEIAGQALKSLNADYPPMASLGEEKLARADQELASVTRFTAAARLVDDPAVLTEMLAWLRTFRASRGMPDAILNASLGALGAAIGRADPRAGRLVLDAIPDGTARSEVLPVTPPGGSG